MSSVLWETLNAARDLDLAAECRNAERIASNFTAHPEIVIPKVYWAWTCERVNVQEAISGIPGRDLEAVNQAGLDRKILAQHGAQAVLKMILEDGFFHADPHPGNVFYLSENRIAFIDFGMVGRLSFDRRTQVVDLLHGLVEIEVDSVVEILLDWTGGAEIDRDSLKLEIDGLARRGWRAVASGLDILTSLPQDLRQLLRSARSGKLQVHVDVTRLQRFGDQLDRAMSRLTMGIVIAALIIGSSIVMTVEHGPVLLGLPLFGLLGFIGAAIGGIWLLISIWRSKRGP